MPRYYFIFTCLLGLSFSPVFSKKFSDYSLKKYLMSLDENIKTHGKVDRNFCTKHRDDLLQLVFLLQWETVRDPNRHILTLFDSVRKTVYGNSFLRREIEKLISTMSRPGITQAFPYENVAYQELLLFIKTWKKKDLHCHVSPSLSARWVIETIRKNWVKKYKPLFVDRVKSRKWKKWREQEKNTVTWRVIEAFVNGKSDSEITTMFIIYENPTDAFDIPIQFAAYDNLEVFLDAVRYVVRGYFDDGVRLVELRFNPCKKFHNVSYPPEMVLKEVEKVVRLEEELASKKYGGEHATRFMLSFNQAKYPNKKDFFCETVRSSVSDRIVGVDLSGEESGETFRSSWGDLFDVKKQQSVCHLGDRWNVDDSFNDNIDKHLEYVKDALSLKRIERIGHCNILWPDYKVFRPYRDCSLRVFDPVVTKGQRESIQEIINIIREKNITISALPKRELQTIPVMKKFPFYYWWKEGISVCVGIDGTSYTRSMLSEWISWLLLAAPRYETKSRASITVEQMIKVVCI